MIHKSSHFLIAIVLLLGSASQAQAVETFGVVAQVRGEVFVVDPTDNQSMTADRPLTALWIGHEIFMQEDAIVRIIDRNGNRYSFVGPAHLTLTGTDSIEITYGTAVVESKEKKSVLVQSAFMSGRSESTAVVWVGEKRTQWLSLIGASEVWHPEHQEVKVLVEQGRFTESSLSQYYVEPRLSMIPDVKKVKHLLTRFHESALKYIEEHNRTLASEQPVKTEPDHHGQSPEPKVTVAEGSDSESKEEAVPHQEPVKVEKAHKPFAKKTTQTKATVVSKTEILDRMLAHIQGEDYVPRPQTPVKESAAVLKERKEREAKIAKVMNREKALRAALQATKVDRIPASSYPKVAQPMIYGVVEKEEERKVIEVDDEKVDIQNGILNRLIQKGKH